MEGTIDAYNDAMQAGTIDHESLDDCKTVGLKPPKSHWALKIDRPPYSAYPLGAGLTFTYLGPLVNDRAMVLRKSGERTKNIFAAGEIMAGNILGWAMRPASAQPSGLFLAGSLAVRQLCRL